MFQLTFFVILFNSSTAFSSNFEDLIKKIESLPPTAPELTNQLAEDLISGYDNNLISLLNDASYDSYDLLIEGLLSGEDGENTIQLIEILESNDQALFKFLLALRENVQSDPKKLERIKNNMSMVYSDLIAQPVSLPVFGARLIQTSLLSLAAIGLSYSIYDSYIYHYFSGDTFVFNKSLLLLLGFVAISSINEFRILKRTWSSYRRQLTRRFKAEKNLKVYLSILKDLRLSSVLPEHLKRLKLITSSQAVDAAYEGLSKYSHKIKLILLDFLDRPDLVKKQEVFYQTKSFKRVLQNLSNRLSEKEKTVLISYINGESDFQNLPITLKTNLLEFEDQTQAKFQEWMNEEGQKTYKDELRRLLAKRNQMENYLYNSSKPRNSYALMTTSLGFIASLMSLFYISDTFNSYGFNSFYDYIMISLKNNRDLLAPTTVITLLLPPVLLQAYQAYKVKVSMKLTQSKDALTYEEINKMTTLLPRRMSTRSNTNSSQSFMCKELL